MTDIQLPPLQPGTLEQNALWDHVYEHGCTSEGVHKWLERVCKAYARAAIEAEKLHTDKLLLASVPGRWKSCASSVGAVQSYIAELEAAIEAHEARKASVAKQEPVAWLVTHGKTFKDRAFTLEIHAQNSQRERNDDCRIVPLYTHPAPVREPLTLEPVHQYRKEHCADWYDGFPDYEDGGGPYETRTLCTPSNLVRKPLSEEQIVRLSASYSLPYSVISFTRAIEAAHGITKDKP